MFGKPVWFKKKSIGWGLNPVTWQGWVYTATWAGILCLPFVALLMRQQIWESGVWLTASMGALTYDVYKIIQAMDVTDAEVVPQSVPPASDPPISDQFATKNYDFYIGDEEDA